MFLGNCSYRYNINVSYNPTYIRGGLSRFGNDTTVTNCNGNLGTCSSLSSSNPCTPSSSSTPQRSLSNEGAFYIVTKYLTFPSTVDTYHSLTQSSNVTTEDGRTLSVSCDLLNPQTNVWNSVGSTYSTSMWAKTCYHIQLRCTNSYISNTATLGTTRSPWTSTCQPCV